MIDDNTNKKHIFLQRERCGISQKEMAERLGMDRTTYRNIEKGNTRLVSPHIDQIARNLGSSPEELVLGYKPNPELESALEEYRTTYEDRYQNLINEYEQKISTLTNEINTLKTLNQALSARIADKEEMIAMLKRQIKNKS